MAKDKEGKKIEKSPEKEKKTATVSTLVGGLVLAAEAVIIIVLAFIFWR